MAPIRGLAASLPPMMDMLQGQGVEMPKWLPQQDPEAAVGGLSSGLVLLVIFRLGLVFFYFIICYWTFFVVAHSSQVAKV